MSEKRRKEIAELLANLAQAEKDNPDKNDIHFNFALKCIRDNIQKEICKLNGFDFD